jgi:tRNA nucleotidyltransferase/poly(A) polymerase
MKFLADLALKLRVADDVYIVGGAVRNFLMGVPIKDIDVVIDTVGAGKDSEWLAKEIQKAIPVATNLTTNQYGVALLAVSPGWHIEKGVTGGREVIEIANARKESYGAPEGKGYKPHMVEPCTIQEDLLRREFTFNTLLWKLSDLVEGPEKAPVTDLLGVRGHLEKRALLTPSPPDKTFSDDPTRMLRAVKFVTRYGFFIDPEVFASIQRNAPKLRQMPWDAVRKLLIEDILQGPEPRSAIALMGNLKLTPVLKTWLDEEPGFGSALGRALCDTSVDVHVILDLYDQEWEMKSPLSFLDIQGRRRLREILKTTDPDTHFAFVEALKKPPIDQSKLFSKYKLEGKDRQRVVRVAREVLLREPEQLRRLFEETDFRLHSPFEPLHPALKYQREV